MTDEMEIRHFIDKDGVMHQLPDSPVAVSHKLEEEKISKPQTPIIFRSPLATPK